MQLVPGLELLLARDAAVAVSHRAHVDLRSVGGLSPRIIWWSVGWSLVGSVANELRFLGVLGSGIIWWILSFPLVDPLCLRWCRRRCGGRTGRSSLCRRCLSRRNGWWERSAGTRCDPRCLICLLPFSRSLHLLHLRDEFGLGDWLALGRRRLSSCRCCRWLARQRRSPLPIFPPEVTWCLLRLWIPCSFWWCRWC